MCAFVCESHYHNLQPIKSLRNAALVVFTICSSGGLEKESRVLPQQQQAKQMNCWVCSEAKRHFIYFIYLLKKADMNKHNLNFAAASDPWSEERKSFSQRSSWFPVLLSTGELYSKRVLQRKKKLFIKGRITFSTSVFAHVCKDPEEL